ncbi:three-Cys-motif partner protein TcmP [Nocardia brasiliensis]|uniref:three-Cys-motif partner protein TcmP n=1 Tax=Nocardia brasiliensis TaxID=37326 RepID=UPI0024567253|nr:three-Cys-motif partner protein TcmP [Nocardia brasiliensis]
MSKGTTSGLLDEVRAQSVFKHQILDSYIIRFVTMTGRRAGRAVLLDGFAGRGRYPDGKPASGERMLLAAKKSKNTLSVEVVLVEKQQSLYRHLAAVTEEYRGQGVTADAYRGQVQDHLDGVINRAQGAPLFLFLDPCGRNLAFDILSSTLRRRRRAWPPTEALLNINADLIRRAAGVARKELTDHAALACVDVMCGGEWWRQLALDAHAASHTATWETAAETVVQEYARRLGLTTGMRSVVVPVRRKQHHQPVYHLVFLTRSEYGRWVFGDAVATARQAWLNALGPADEEVADMLFDMVECQIEAEQDGALRAITDNLVALVASGLKVKLVDHTMAVFGDNYYGVAQERLVRTAARELSKSGRIALDATAKQPRDWVIGPVQRPLTL